MPDYTLTISSDVKVNGSPVSARFTTITLANVKYPVEIAGHAALGKPVSFTWRHMGMQTDNLTALGAIAAAFVAREPRRTLAGYIDAVCNVGTELCKVTYGPSAGQVLWGYLTVETSATGGNETTIVTVHPVDRLRFVANSDYLEPDL